jgi:hypothetical protein
MIYNVYRDAAREQAYSQSYAQAKAQLESQYDDGKTRLETLCKLNHVHLNNLTYLEQVASKYGLDVPLKSINELQAERKQLRQVRTEIGLLEKKLNQEDTSREIDRQEYEAAEAQRRSKLIQAETYRQNISYLEELAGKQKSSVPLSLHNAFREEVQRLIFVRQCIAKIDRHMQILASALDIGGNSPQMGYRRKDHRGLIEQARASQMFQPSTLKIIGLCSIEQNTFCVITWGNKICVLDFQSPANEKRFAGLLCAYVENVSGEKPRLLDPPNNLDSFYERFGQAVLTLDFQYAEKVDMFSYMTMTPTFQAELSKSALNSKEFGRARFDFDFHLETDVVYINTDQSIVGGGRWLWWWEIRKSQRRRKKS